LSQVLSEFWQHGDRLALLKEAHRILAPDGRLLVAERVRTETNWLVMGPAALGLHGAGYWRNLLGQAGFRVQKEQQLLGLIHCIRANKPTPAEARQLAFELDY
jgi:ubiquinone/menaquinone biosynthesis C-methylase UbiE